MNKNIFEKKLMSLIFGAAALMAPFALTAASVDAADECAKELLLSYFPEPIVKDTLKKFSIPEDKWAGITTSLGNKDKEVVKIVEEKASKMNPNPLKDPQQRPAAVKLFRETLLQVFTDALKENGITDSAKFQTMLDDIQQQKAKKFAMCIEKKKAQAQAGNTDEDTDESDEDYDDDEEDDDDQEDDKTKSDVK